MSLQRTGAFSSRISKPPAFRRSSSGSPFATAKRKKPGPSASPADKRNSLSDRRKSDGHGDSEGRFVNQLEDHGILATLATDLRFSDVAQLVRIILSRMFAPIPETASGMNSVRIAEVLNYRLRLPPIVTTAHIHALSPSSTKVEKEISELAARGIVRKLMFAGRGDGAEAVGEGLVLVEDWQKLIRASEGLCDGSKEKYCHALEHPQESTSFTPKEIAELLATGFLTRTTGRASKADTFSQLSATNLGTLTNVVSSGSSYISGTANAAAEALKENISGGHGAADRLRGIDQVATRAAEQFTFSLPNTGPYLKLLHEAKTHLQSLLAKASRFRELPENLLKERWEGGVAGSDDATRAAKARGEFKGILPGRTKRWKQFYGLECQWVLEECLGGGLVECFKTGSVGVGVRML